jgi:hypothetical protein
MDERDLILEAIEKRKIELREIIAEKDKNFDFSKDWFEYKKYLKEEEDELEFLSREKRMIMPYTLQEIPNYGDIMTLEEFIKCVKSGGFIDYDGSGNYLEFNKMTNIDIYPSDVEFNKIRTQFDRIIWFNR